MPILSMEEMLGPQNLSVGIVGAPKTGKTESLATLLKYFDRTKQPNRIIELYDLDEDGSVSIIRKLGPKSSRNPDGLDRLNQLRVHRFRRKAGEKIETAKDEGIAPTRNPDDWFNFANEFNQLYDQIDTSTGKWRKPDEAPGAVVIDSMSALQEIAWDFVLAKRNKEIGIDSRRIGFDEWNILRSKTESVIKAAKGLPCVSIFLFHLDYKQEEAGKHQRITDKGQVILEPIYVEGSYHHVPFIVGQLAHSIMKNFGVCLESSYRMGRYQWKVVPDDRSQTIGSRAYAKFGQQFIDQDFDLVL